LTGPIAARVAALPLRRPWLLIGLCALLALIGGGLATRLELRTRFEQLLPDHEPSVVELRRVQEHLAASQHVFIVLEGDDPGALRELGDTLVPKLRDVGPPWVTSAQDGVQEAETFLRPRAAMFLGVDDLQKLSDDVEARWDWEIGKSTGSNLDDDPPPEITAASLRSRFGLSQEDRFPGGYYQSRDGRALVVVARSAVEAGELERAQEALRRIKAVVRPLATGRFDGVRVGYAGDLVTSLAEYGAVRADLVSVGALGVALVLAVVFLFFMRLRVLIAMGITIGVGLAWTFGLTEIAIGHLNVATGFLFSIVAGNGINFGIIYMARFYEELRAGHSQARALAIAQSATWPATLTAALAAAASYASLGVTDFRAFKHFAFIGSAGMVLCWIATYVMLPGILGLFEGARPFVKSSGAPASATTWQRLRLRGIPYDRPFGFVVPRAPRILTLVGVGVAAAGYFALGPYLRADPMQYDMRKLQNDAGESRDMYRASTLARDVLGTQLEDSMVVLCDRLEQVKALKHALEARRDASPSEGKPFEAAHTLLDFVPDGQEQKISIALALRDRLIRAHERGGVSEADWADLERSLPPADLRAWDLQDLPDELARPFTERDGTRGRLVLIEPAAGKSDADLRYLLRWANSFRETRLPDGSIVRGSGRAVIFADMLEAVQKDMPRAVTLSFAMTVFAVVLTFRRGSLSAAVIGALLVGLGWVAAAMAATRLKIDFFNFVALPITFGIGVDYAVNIVQRYGANPRGGILAVVRGSGGPVILCSLTTMLGYLALLSSMNRAIRGLGLLAVFGEVACLLAALLVLPAALVWWERVHEGAPSEVEGGRLGPAS
jgi:predicted RND superfamily exporter protein